MKQRAVKLVAVTLVLSHASALVAAQDYSKYSPAAQEAELAAIAVSRLGVMVPMRDGVALSTDIYTPKKPQAKQPVILWRTPYNEHKLRGSTLRYVLESVKRGYTFIVQNERGRYFSQGQWEILGHPQTDAYDALTWIASQPWSNGKVGTLGCSSSAEWQLALAGMNHPAHAAMVPMSAGAGIGKVGRFQEQGNWYTGGVPRNLFFVWLYGVDNPLRAELPATLTDEKMRARIEAYNDLDATKPKVDWNKQIKHLPVNQMLTDLGEPPATFEQLIARTPADPAWNQGGLYHEGMGWGVPALWFNTWYDVSIGPNMELFNLARTANTDKEASANQYAVIAPVPHCQFAKLGPDTVVGERDMGDTSFDVDGAVYSWFDRWLKGDGKAFPASTPRVRYYLMGANRWQSAAQWPPQEARPLRLYLRSGGKANSLYGDGRLASDAPPAAEAADRYRYDPMNPVQTIGGGDCCNGGVVIPGAFDQRQIESRQDVLVYSSEPLTAPVDVVGFVDAVLKVSSSAKDTDFAVKLVDVAPDGTALIIGDTIFRARYRDGYDKPAMMAPDQVYTIRPTPITTANRFAAGHRIRVEVTSSNFPKFVRNLNTGGPNESEKTGVVADNVIHHEAAAQSYIELPVLPAR
ncbi:putative CocE/NonD family hydrolase [Duganella sp. 3397]|uniref:CocE/NonD family hydrolase n=1 Tax=Duganella sp. 3397 TaxID=2817732 RepID=UPI0028634ABC|nr:CocE/NonD family hydrolase [Duganella sp. 3397]MDR7049621.1 putative CocE/NonD family hydrolase [Duganella sp. 3397]